MKHKPPPGYADIRSVPICYSCAHKEKVEAGIICCDLGSALQRRSKCIDYKKHKWTLPGFSSWAIQIFWAPLVAAIIAGIIAGVVGTLLVQLLIR
ncbi:MAG: hypothetical protein LBP74_06075 [Treponema sp.]|jgi:hypothetical protein|nr:hypothetical protein [Treponema sp.]